MVEPAIVRQSFELENLSGSIIHGDTRYDSAVTGKRPAVIICHSFMAFKDWGFFPYVAEQFSREGFVSVTFNFSHNGVEDNRDRITNFVLFETNTFSQELEDLKIVI